MPSVEGQIRREHQSRQGGQEAVRVFWEILVMGSTRAMPAVSHLRVKEVKWVKLGDLLGWKDSKEGKGKYYAHFLAWRIS